MSVMHYVIIEPNRHCTESKPPISEEFYRSVPLSNRQQKFYRGFALGTVTIRFDYHVRHKWHAYMMDRYDQSTQLTMTQFLYFVFFSSLLHFDTENMRILDRFHSKFEFVLSEMPAHNRLLYEKAELSDKST